jgi:hypothetical protein
MLVLAGPAAIAQEKGDLKSGDAPSMSRDGGDALGRDQVPRRDPVPPTFDRAGPKEGAGIERPEAPDGPRAEGNWSKEVQPKPGRDDGKARSEGRDEDLKGKDESATGTSSGESGQAERDGGKSGGVSITQEQRTRVRDAFKGHHVKGKTDLDINVSIGVAVPRSVELYVVPEEIVVIVPAYKRYKYFVVDDRVYIVDPATLLVVDIIIIA